MCTVREGVDVETQFMECTLDPSRRNAMQRDLVYSMIRIDEFRGRRR